MSNYPIDFSSPRVLKNPIILLVFLFFWTGLKAQNDNNIFISGKVTDAQTATPTPYVNIYLLSGRYGVTSDLNGEYVFRTSKDYLNDTVRVSCIGYESQNIPLRHLKENTDILLKPSIAELEEIVVESEKLTDFEIIKNTRYSDFREGKNYFAQTFYKGRAINEKNKTLYDVEAIIQLMRFTKEIKVGGVIEFVQKRNFMKDSVIDKLYFDTYYWRNRNRYGFHNISDFSDLADILTFNETEFATFEGKTIYKVNYSFSDERFRRKRNLEFMGGTIYVDISNFGIVRWEIEARFKDIDTDKLRYRRKHMSNIHPISFTHVKNYHKTEGDYYPSSLEINRRDYKVNKNGTVEKIDITHSFEYIDFEFVDYPWAEFYDRNDPRYPNDLNNAPYDKDFWDNFDFHYKR